MIVSRYFGETDESRHYTILFGMMMIVTMLIYLVKERTVSFTDVNINKITRSSLYFYKQSKHYISLSFSILLRIQRPMIHYRRNQIEYLSLKKHFINDYYEMNVIRFSVVAFHITLCL